MTDSENITDHMKITNQEILHIYSAYFEMLNVVEAKKQVDDSGRLFSRIADQCDALELIVKALSKKEKNLKDQYAHEIEADESGKAKQKLQDDLNDLYAEEKEIELYQISEKNADLFAKYVYGNSTRMIYKYIVKKETTALKAVKK